MPTDALDELLKCGHVHVALERVRIGGLQSFGYGKVYRFGPGKLDVGARGVKVSVVGHNVVLLAHHAEQNALGGTALMRGDDVLVTKDVLYDAAQLLKAAAAGVAFVPFHHGTPLPTAHGARARIGEQIN